jgi:hypothetical protein
MDNLGIAETVVIRHICHCKTATEHPGHDEVTEHMFTVDDQEFPWYISERGPIVARLTDDLYTIDVELLLLDRETKTYLPFSYTSRGVGSVPYVPVIDGQEFPWTCTADEFVLRFSHKQIPSLRLKFYARNVDAKGIAVDDKRLTESGRDIHRAGGDLIHGKTALSG